MGSTIVVRLPLIKNKSEYLPLILQKVLYKNFKCTVKHIYGNSCKIRAVFALEDDANECHESWKPSSVVRGYLEDSIENKKQKFWENGGSNRLRS